MELWQSLQIYRTRWPQRREVLAAVSSELGECVRRCGRFGESEALLLAAHETLASAGSSVYFLHSRQSYQRIVGLYRAWNAAEPGQGYDQKAAEWQAALDQVQPTPVQSREVRALFHVIENIEPSRPD